MSTATKYRTCHLCEAMCGLEIKIENNEIISIQGHQEESITIPSEITEDIIAGTISIPHGWGHHEKDTKMEVAQADAGVNSNTLMSHERLDPLSYNSAFNGHPIRIRKISSSIGKKAL